MKLLNCTRCHDILSLGPFMRTCACEKSSARYINETQVEYSGPARILGITNNEYARSLKVKTKLSADGSSDPRFTWFVIVEGRNIKKVDGDNTKPSHG